MCFLEQEPDWVHFFKVMCFHFKLLTRTFGSVLLAEVLVGLQGDEQFLFKRIGNLNIGKQIRF